MSSRSLASIFFATATLVLYFFVSAQAHAQVTGATLSGTASDASGAIVPNAQISIKNLATGESRVVMTNAAGLYAAPNLLPGNYEVTASAQGFSTAIRTGIGLTVGAQQVLNITMAVGDVQQKVEVTGEAPTVEVSSSTLGAVVDSNTVRELPLNGRDWTALAALEPGVVSATALQYSSLGTQRGGRGFGAQLIIAGTRPFQTSYRFDGVNVNDAVGGSPGSVTGASLGVDAVQEFSVMTSSYSAEYGRTSGGVVNAVSRSGTNQIHGTAFDFLRNSALDARNFFDGSQIPEFRRNQFGGSLGAPIRKDSTFVFGGFEGLRQALSTTVVDVTPSADARRGLIHNADGTTTQLNVSPLVQPFLGLWPLPTLLLAPGNTGDFFLVGKAIANENFGTVRVDQRFSDKDSAFVTWQIDRSNLTQPDSLNDVLLSSETQRQLAVIEENHIFNPQLFNSFRVGLNRSRVVNSDPGSAINPLTANLSLSTVPGRNAPQVSVTGITAFTGGVESKVPGVQLLNAFQWYDDLFLTKGRHSLKFGFAAEHDLLNWSGAPTAGGRWSFGSLTNFLTDVPTSLTAQIPGTISISHYTDNIFGGYVQDDVHVWSNLTVNLGVRYEMSTVPTEKLGHLSTLLNITDPSPHTGNPLFNNPTLRNFSPRVGFAWDPFRNGKTSIRGGYGLFDVLPLVNEYASVLGMEAPFSLSGSGTVSPGSFPTGAFNTLATASNSLRNLYIEHNPKRNYVQQWNFSLQRELAPNLTVTLSYVGSHSVHLPFLVNDANIVLPSQNTAEGYIWPSGTGQLLNPNVGRIDFLTWSSSSVYHALQTRVTKRLSHGFQVQGSYTWGKSIDTSSGVGTPDSFQNSITSMFFFDPKLHRGLSDFNVAQTLSINYTWMIHSPQSLHGPLAWAASGWQVGGVFQANTGQPFTPLIGGDALGLRNTDAFDYPDHLNTPGCQSPINPGNPNNYLKLNCFSLPPATPDIASLCKAFSAAPGTCKNLVGNTGRNSVIGPGVTDFDFSLFKNNYIKKVSEVFNAQFRIEIFNIFNHPNFGSLVNTSNSIFDVNGNPVAGAGRLTTQGTSSRQIQFALKLVW
jgi:hypothetical protein